MYDVADYIYILSLFYSSSNQKFLLGGYTEIGLDIEAYKIFTYDLGLISSLQESSVTLATASSLFYLNVPPADGIESTYTTSSFTSISNSIINLI